VQKLRALRLEHCTGIDAAMGRVLGTLRWLERLVFHDCPDCGEGALLELAAAAPKLARLEVFSCARAGEGVRAAVLRARERARGDALAARARLQTAVAAGMGCADMDGGHAECLGGAAGEGGRPLPAVPELMDMVWDGGSPSGEAGSW
jgi:hypothetical protein